MAVTLAGTDALANVVTDAQSQGGAKDRANWANAIYGGHRWLAEFVDGAKYDTAQAAPDSGLGGAPGHDHSGGRMGMPLQHTVFLGEFGTYPDPTLVLRSVCPQGTVSASIASDTVLQRDIWMFVPPGIAYRRLSITALVYATAACSVRIKASWFGQQSVFDTTLVAATTTLVKSHTTNVMLPAGVPGRFNELRVTVEARYTSATATLGLMSLGVHQVQSTP